MTIERVGEAFEAEVRLTVLGRRLAPGDVAPEFELEELEPGDAFPRPVTLQESAATVRIFHTVNSLDTPVCHAGACRWDFLWCDGPSEGIELYTISMDLPFAQVRWRNAIGARHRILSCHQSERFGRDYGLLLAEWRLLQRAVFVVDQHDRIVYAEYVADQMRQVDHHAAMNAARRVMDGGATATDEAMRVR